MEESLTFLIYALKTRGDINNVFRQNGFLFDLIRGKEKFGGSQQGLMLCKIIKITVKNRSSKRPSKMAY